MGRDPDPPDPRSRFRRALDTHGARGLPFALARRLLDTLEDKLNPRHVNRFDFGYSDVFTQPCDPVAALYSIEFQTLVVEVPRSELRWSRMGLRLDDANPFVRTVADHLAGRSRSYDGSALQRYFTAWQPASSAAVLGLDATDAPVLSQQPPQAVALPWAAEAGVVDPLDRLQRVDRFNRAESRATGVELGLDAGHKHFGPVTDDFGRLEFERYTGLADAVARQGFRARVAEGYVGVQLLVDGDRHAAFVTGPGLHRAVVAAAAGVDPLTVMVEKQPTMVHRADVESWPGVRSGLFTAATAGRVFDRVLAGEPPAGFPILP